MKKIVTIVLSAILFVCLTACGEDGTGTVIPSSSEIQTNLENKGYSIETTQKVDDLENTCLTAQKENEYLKVYWLKNADDCDYFYNKLAEEYTDYNTLVEFQNDEKFGNIVICGTESAVKDSGIEIVNVNVNVKV